MRHLLLAASAALALLLVPAASAALDPDPWNVEEDVGPCHVARVIYMEGAYTLVECTLAGQEILYYWDSVGMLGHHCALRVAGVTLQECPNENEW